MIDYSALRKNMVESQVRPSDVTDRRIIRAMLDIPREAFVPEARRSVAYMDDAITVPLEGGASRRALLAPRVLAKLIQLLELEATDVVLDIGCATGYSAAIVARIVQTVVALESDAAMAAAATRTLGELSVDNVAVVTGPLTAGYMAEGPYDAILIEGMIAEPPAALLDQLKDGGRLAAVVHAGPIGRATVWRRLGQTFGGRAAFDAAAPLLEGFEPRPAFVF